MSEGDRERASGDYGKAHLAYLRAHLIDRESLAPLERIAYLALRTEPESAPQLFRELLEEAPGKASLQVGLAYAEITRGNLEFARPALERALEADPDSRAAHSALAIVQDRFHEHEQARTSYAHVAPPENDDRQLLNNLGVSKLLAGNAEGAIAFLERARRLTPESPLISNNFGLALGLAGHDQPAFEAFRSHGSRGDALNNLGFVCYLRGDHARARELFEEALLSNETDELRVLRNLERLESVATTK